MGCTGSKTAPPVVITEFTNVTTTTTAAIDFTVVVQQVKQTWPDVQKIDQFGAKIFSHLLHTYPELRSFYHIPEAYQTETELLNADEIEQEGNKFVSLYSDIIENSETKFNEILHEKAAELHQQGVQTSQLKYLGDSFLHVIQDELQNRFNTEEKQSWQLFNSQVMNGLAAALATSEVPIEESEKQ